MSKEEKLVLVAAGILLWTLFFFAVLYEANVRFGKGVAAQELDSKCDEGRVIQDAAFDAQLYFKLPLTSVWMPAGYFSKGVHLIEIAGDGRNFICVFGDLTLAEGVIFSETNFEREKIGIEYRILSGERKALSLEMAGRLIKVLRTEGNKSVSKTYLINSQDGSAGIQSLFVYLRGGSAESHIVFFPFDEKLFSAKFYRSPGDDGMFLYQGFVSPVEKPLVEKTGKENEAIKEVFLRVKNGKIIGAEAIFNQKLKIVLTWASE